MAKRTIEIPAEALQNLSPQEVAKQYNCSLRTVYHRRKELHLGKEFTSVPPIVRGALESWDPNTAYIMGAMAADGCICRDGRSILTSQDRDWLEDIGTLLFEYPRKLWVGSGNCWILGLPSILTNHLVNYGLKPAKSLTLEWPKVPAELEGHFIRGYFDGDGSVYIQELRGRQTPRLKAQFYTGSVQFADELQGCLEHYGLNIYRVKTTCYHITIADEASLGILYWLMYHENGVYMARKKEIFDEFWSLERCSPGNPKLTLI